MSRGLVLCAAAAAAIAVAGYLALRDLAAPPPPQAPGAAAGGVAPQATDGAPQEDDAAPPSEPRSEVPGARPPSLAGTRVDGGLVTDADGRFVPTPDARRLFDYFLAASGEEPEAALVARIRVEIDGRLSPEAARDAHLLLDRYLAYRARARTLAEQGLGEASAAERLEALRELRRATLGREAADALFAEEEEVDATTVAKLELELEELLTDDERRQRAAEMDAALPPAERASRREATAALDLRAAEAALAASGGSPDELRALRERTVGVDAAERLAALDVQRAGWRQRVDDYRRAREAIEADPALDAEQRAKAVARLRAERFSDTEQVRLDALDEIESR